MNTCGTKWEWYDCSEPISINENTIFLEYNIAWEPPKLVYEKMVSLGYSVFCVYADEGWSFFGWSTGNNDDVYNDIENQSLLDIEEDLKNCTQNLKIPDVIMEKIKETLKQYYIDNCDGKDDACDEN